MCSDRGDSEDAGHWVEQGHVFCTDERQTLRAVMVHHLGDAGKDAAALVQGVTVFFGLSDDDVNATLARPDSQRREEEEEEEEKAALLMTSRFLPVYCPYQQIHYSVITTV